MSAEEIFECGTETPVAGVFIWLMTSQQISITWNEAGTEAGETHN